MGYYTIYNLTVHKGTLDIDEILCHPSSGGFRGVDYAFDIHGNDLGDVKWYDHEIDMKELSKLFPDTVFSLQGTGEESLDLWFKYFKDGKMQDCPAIISYDDYDESKLE